MTHEDDLARHLIDGKVALEQAAVDFNNVIGQLVLENSGLVHPGLMRALDAVQQISIAAADMALATGKYVLGVDIDAATPQDAGSSEDPVEA